MTRWLLLIQPFTFWLSHCYQHTNFFQMAWFMFALTVSIIKDVCKEQPKCAISLKPQYQCPSQDATILGWLWVIVTSLSVIMENDKVMVGHYFHDRAWQLYVKCMKFGEPRNKMSANYECRSAIRLRLREKVLLEHSLVLMDEWEEAMPNQTYQVECFLTRTWAWLVARKVSECVRFIKSQTVALMNIPVCWGNPEMIAELWRVKMVVNSFVTILCCLLHMGCMNVRATSACILGHSQRLAGSAGGVVAWKSPKNCPRGRGGSRAWKGACWKTEDFACTQGVLLHQSPVWRGRIETCHKRMLNCCKGAKVLLGCCHLYIILDICVVPNDLCLRACSGLFRGVMLMGLRNKGCDKFIWLPARIVLCIDHNIAPRKGTPSLMRADEGHTSCEMPLILTLERNPAYDFLVICQYAYQNLVLLIIWSSIASIVELYISKDMILAYCAEAVSIESRSTFHNFIRHP